MPANDFRTQLVIEAKTKGAPEVKKLNNEIKLIKNNVDSPTKNESFKSIENGAASAASSVSKASGAIRGVISSLGKIGISGAAIGITGVGTAIIAAGAAAIKSIDEFIPFQKALKEIETIGGDVSASLQNSFLDLGAEFGTDATAQAKAYYQIVSAGITNQARASEVLKASNEVALGGISDIGSAINVVTDILNVYGQDVITATEASDSLFQTVKLGKTTMPELASTLGQVLPSAKNLGISLDEVNAALAAMTTQGLTTSERVTQLNALFTAIIRTNGKLGDGLDANALRTKGLSGFLTDLNEKYKGNFDALVPLLGRTEGYRAVLALTGDNLSVVNRNLDEFKGKAGASASAAEKMADSLDIKKKQLQEEWNALYKAFGEKLSPAVEDFTDATREAVHWLRELFTTSPSESVDQILKLESQMSALVERRGEIDKMISSYNSLSDAQKAFASGELARLENQKQLISKQLESLNKERNDIAKSISSGEEFGPAVTTKVQSSDGKASKIVDIEEIRKARDEANKFREVILKLREESAKQSGQSSFQFSEKILEEQKQKLIESAKKTLKGKELQDAIGTIEASFKLRAEQTSLEDTVNQIKYSLDQGLEDINIDSLNSLIDQMNSVEGVSRDTIRSVESALRSAIKSISDPELINALNASLEKVKIEVSGTNDEFKKLKDEGLDIVKNETVDFFQSITDGTKSASEAFEDFAKSVIKSIQRIALQKGIEAIFKGFGAKDGGAIVQQFASGGSVIGPGTGTSDSIPAMLSNGEFVMTARAHRFYGTDIMSRINKTEVPRDRVRRFADGGSESQFSDKSNSGSKVTVNITNNTSSQVSDSVTTKQIGDSLSIDIALEDTIRRGGSGARALERTYGLRRAGA